jgi:hypothetical protein
MRWLRTTRIAGDRLLSRAGYAIATALGFITLFLFAACLVVGYAYWQSLGWLARIGLGLVVIVLTPSLDDVRSLFLSYDSYKRAWEEHREKGTAA